MRKTYLRVGFSSLALLLCAGLWLVLTNDRGEPEQRHESKTQGPALLRAFVMQRAAPAEADAGIYGTVRNASGQPIAGARVCASCASCEPTSTSAQFCAQTDVQGAYALHGLGSVGYRVAAMAEGFASGLAQAGTPVFVVPGSARTGVDITLSDRGVELSGQVADAAGGPVPEAKVRIVRWDQPPSVIDVQADKDGEFKGWTAPGRVTLIASADGYSSARTARIAPASKIALVLTPAGSIEGLVRHAQDGRPVVGAEVHALGASMSPVSGRRSSLTDADGRFVVANLEPSRHVLTASAPGYVGQSADAIAVGLGESVKGVEIFLSAAAQVSGTVLVGSTGEPCQEGSVMLGPPSHDLGMRPGAKLTYDAAMAGERAPATLYSPIGARGAVHFDAVRAGRYFVTVQCRDHTLRDGPDVLIVQQKDLGGLTWRVEPGLGLAVRVVDEAQRPVAGAELYLEWPKRHEGATPRTLLTMDHAGRHTLGANLYPGVYTLLPSSGYQADPVAISLRDGAGIVDALVRLQGSAAIDLHVTASDDGPIDGLSVRAHALEAPDGSSSAITAINLGAGHYRVAPLRPGRYRVEVEDGINAPVEAGASGAPSVQVAAGETASIALELARDQVISGQVVDSAGAPVPNAWVSAASGAMAGSPGARRPPRPPWDTRGRVLTDGDGRFTITQLAARAEYDVRAELPEGSTVIKRAIHSGAGLKIVLPAPASIRGLVTDASGKPVNAFTVRTRETESGSGRTREFAGTNGHFLVDGLVPGRVQITIVDRTGRVGESQAVLEPGRLRDGITIELPAPELVGALRTSEHDVAR